MTEEQKPKYLEDLTRYQYANVAGRFMMNKEDSRFIPGALEKMVDSFGIDKDMIEGFKAGAFASKEGVETATKIYAQKYHQALENLSLSEFYDVRSGTLKSLFGDEKAEEYKSFFGKYEGQTVGSIVKKITQSQTIINDQTGLFDEEKKKEAKKTLEKYASISNVIKLLEDRNFEELRSGATKLTYKELIKKEIEGEENGIEE